MKVCFLLQDIGAVYGAERATLDLARGLRAVGVEVAFLLIKETRLGIRKSGLEEALSQEEFQVRSIPTSKRFSFRLVSGIRAALQEMSADVLHSVGAKSTVHGCFVQQIPNVATVHGWLFRKDWKEQSYRRLEQWALRRYSAVVTPSAFYRDLLDRKSIQRVRHIPSGIDLNGERVVARSGDFTVGMLARFSEEKNHAMLLNSLDSLDQGRGLLAGEGPLRMELEARVKEMDLSARVQFGGYMERETFFAQIDVLVLCSRIENLPYCTLEAMAQGIPVVATDVGGIPELVEDGRNGFLVKSDDATGMAQAIQKLAKDAGLRQRMGTAGRTKVALEFTVDHMVDAHVELYRSLR